MKNFENYLDKELFKKFNYFLIKMNERSEFQYGLRDRYIEPENDPALGYEVEWFHPSILYDDRMRYIVENIVGLPDEKLSAKNKVGNTVISHFYGGRGIHQLVTGISDVKKAHVDFERLGNGDPEYLESLKENCRKAKQNHQKLYGTTELHTSLQTSGRNYCREKYGIPDKKSESTDILEWIGGWTVDGTVDQILNDTKSLKEMFTLLTKKPGIGEYYGYHCSTSNSVNPALPFDNDERFCAPGPGARWTLDRTFAKLKAETGGKMPYGDLIIWVRENQHRLIEGLVMHPFCHNFVTESGVKIFKDEQDELKVYGTEVAHCQFGIYMYLTENPKLISKRKVARVEAEPLCPATKGKAGSGLEDLFE
jgi:hypothetical protein